MLALIVTVPATEAELASDLLWALGVMAIEEREPGPPTQDHFVELWTSLGPDAGPVTAAAEAFPNRWRWRLEDVDESVADSWRAHVKPTWILDRLVIVPAWLDFEPTGGEQCVRIDPGEVFGLGDHPTTVLTARAMLEVLRPGDRVLDVGCGSGVLSVVAALNGAASVTAVDIHPGALPVTRANAARNGVEAAVRVTSEPLSGLEGPYEVIVANILAPALIDLAPDLVRLLAVQGTLIISGVLAHAHDHVTAALAPLQVQFSRHLDGWAATSLSGVDQRGD